MADELLRPGADWQLNACLNFGVDKWDLYSSGYRTAAEALTAHVRDSHQDTDRLIYPVIFLWRHHLELEIKSIIAIASRLVGRSQAALDGHDLCQLFGVARQLVDEFAAGEPGAVPLGITHRVRDALRKFNTVDSTSQVFRYPVDKQACEYLPGVQHINYQVVDDYMRSVSEALGDLMTALDIVDQWRLEQRGDW